MVDITYTVYVDYNSLDEHVINPGRYYILYVDYKNLEDEHVNPGFATGEWRGGGT